MAQAPPTFVSTKNNANTPASHLHRQIELQSNAQTPFLEAYRTAPADLAAPTLIFDTVVKDSFKRYDLSSGIYVFPVNGYWIATVWMTTGVVSLNAYWTPLNFADPAPNLLFANIGTAVMGGTAPETVTWQFFAGPTVYLSHYPGFPEGKGFNAMSVTGGPGHPGPFTCQLDLTCMAQY